LEKGKTKTKLCYVSYPPLKVPFFRGNGVRVVFRKAAGAHEVKIENTKREQKYEIHMMRKVGGQGFG